jgi:hypothetical protein
MSSGRFSWGRTLPSLASILLVVVLGACGGDDDGDAEGNGPIDRGTAFNFSENNMADAARIGIGLLGVIPRFSVVALGLFDLLIDGVSAANVPFPPAAVINVPVGEDMCLGGGRAHLRWNDADNNAQLSSGDSAELDLASCDFEDDGEEESATGAVTFAFTSVALPDISSNVTVSIRISDSVGTLILTGNFGLSMASPDLPNYTATYTAEDPDGFLRVREGPQNAAMGCFRIEQTFSLPALEEGYFDISLSPDAAVNANGKIFSITSTGFAPLAFQPYQGEDSSYPDDGGMRFFSFLLTAEEGCATIGSPNGVGDSDESNFILRALPGDSDDVTLELRDQGDNTVATEETTWAALTD